MDHNENEITTDDILETLNEMGLELESQEDIDRLVKAVQDLDSGSLDDSVFIDQPLDVEEYRRFEHLITSSQTPISQRRPDALYTDLFLPDPRPRSDAAHLTISAIPDVDRLIACAYDMIGRLYETSREIDNYIDSRNQDFAEDFNKDSVNKENVQPESVWSRQPLPRSRSFDSQTSAQLAQPQKIHRICSQPSTSNLDNVRKASEVEKEPETLKSAKDLGLRSILKPEPGRLRYRNDPVRKIEMLREEWKQRPPVNEKKRLAVRWRVREYMLRQAESSYDPRRPPRPVLHPKDWSPRPYLD